ncbi:MAG: ABC transporter permease [Oscillospiraceae bacterium]|nr:ABC transporter permease [Oscillospiraceae bacterium]
MVLSDNIKIAIYSIKTNALRASLTMLGIIIGVASVIAIITVGNGGRDYIVKLIKDLGGSSVLEVNVLMNSSPDDYITPDDLNAIKTAFPDVVSGISPFMLSIGGISTPEGVSGMGAAVGVYPDYFNVFNTPCVYGKFFTEEEFMSGKNVAVINTTNAIAIFGEENAVGRTIYYAGSAGTVPLKIIGVMDIMSAIGIGGGTSDSMMSMVSSFGGGMTSAMLFVPTSFCVNSLGMRDRYDMIFISAYDERQLSSLEDSVKNILQARHNNYDRDVYQVINMASIVDILDTVITILTLFIAAVGGISLVVGGIGVMNIMFVSVMERTREIGIRKALGARTRTILMQFLTESVIICLIGGVIGLSLGVGGAGAVSYIMKIPMQIKISTILLAVGFSSAIGIFFGMYPAQRAAEMPPIEALRRE